MPKAYEHPSVSTHWKGLVCPEALDVPFQCFVRQILKGPTAAFLDEALTNIARARAPLERQIGRRLSKIREKRLFVEIGKSSFKDYAAERLDLGASSAGAMARTAEALERLPLLRQASDAPLLTSSHVRDLVRVMTPETDNECSKKTPTGGNIWKMMRATRGAASCSLLGCDSDTAGGTGACADFGLITVSQHT